MAVIWKRIAENYDYIINDLGHPLTKGWLLVDSPIPLLVILVAYNIFCTKIGPMLMKNRPPFKLEMPIKIYNIFQVLISLYITYEGYIYVFSGKFNFNCQGIEEGEERVARGIQVYLITKLIELLDTVFFVLRKSDRQITFLHLYHHTLMPTATWIGIKYFPGGQGVLFGMINSFVHVIMYSYYFISGLGPKYQKYLWWKKYLTVLQIVQFFIVLIHSVNSLFYSCSFLSILKVLIIFFASVFIYMFSKFYYLTYLVKKDNTQNKMQKTVTNGNTSKAVENSGNSVSGRKIISHEGNSLYGGHLESSGSKDEYKKNGNRNSNGSSLLNDRKYISKENGKDL